MTPSRARKSFSKASPYFFFYKDRAGFDGDRFNAVRLFRVISKDSAERDSLDESSAFLIEGAQWVRFRGACQCRFGSGGHAMVSFVRRVVARKYYNKTNY